LHDERTDQVNGVISTASLKIPYIITQTGKFIVIALHTGGKAERHLFFLMGNFNKNVEEKEICRAKKIRDFSVQRDP
jgi:hypothetical protein